MDTYKNEMIWYGTWYLNSTINGTVNGTLLQYYLNINILVNSHVYGPGQSLINDNCTVVSIIKSTLNEMVRYGTF